MLNQNKAKNFLYDRHIAIVGVSSEGKGFGVTIYNHLSSRNFNVAAVNLNGGNINGKQIHKSLREIKDNIDTIITVVPPKETEKVVKEANEIGINKIWMQLGSDSAEAVKYCEENGIEYIQNQCVIMFAEPIGFIHKLHKWIWKATGKIT